MLTGINQAGQQVIVRSAVMNLVPEQTLFLRLGMVSACQNMMDCCQGKTGCGLTCIDGACVSEQIDSLRLPPYHAGFENEVACTGGATFRNTATGAPLTVTGTSCPAGGSCLDGVCLSPPINDAGAEHPAGTPTCTRNSDCVGNEPLTGVVAITDNAGFSDEQCALLHDGTVKCWLSSSAYPTEITGAKSISGTLQNLCAVTTSGTVQCFGNNQDGQLGNGSTSDASAANVNGYVTKPVTVSGVEGATAVSAGVEFACALVSGGAVKCWGYGGDGELGNGDTASSDVPVAVSGLSGATAISAGYEMACALETGGTVQCWGFNYYGGLGTNIVGVSATPVPITGVSGATAISVGVDSACAVVAGGGVECWGDNSLGQLGTSAVSSSSTPLTVTGISGATAVSVGYDFACALLTGGTVQCWGDNAHGELGTPVTTTAAGARPPTDAGAPPTTVPGVSGATAIAAGYQSACALLTDGTVRCWGYVSDSDKGNSPTVMTTGPVCAFGYCVDTCVTSTNCPNNARCVGVYTASADAGLNDPAGIVAVACEAPEVAACTATTTCPAPLVCGPDKQCHNSCTSSDSSLVGCLPTQVCTTTTMLCADPTIDTTYDPAINDFTGSAGGRGGPEAAAVAAPAGLEAAVVAAPEVPRVGAAAAPGAAASMPVPSLAPRGEATRRRALSSPTSPTRSPTAPSPGPSRSGSTKGVPGLAQPFASGTVGTLTLTGGALNFTAVVETPTTTTPTPYNGFVLGFGAPTCVDAGKYTGVSFTIQSLSGTCNTVMEFTDSDHITATTAPGQGSCVSSSCYPSDFTINASTVMLPFKATPSNPGQPTAAVDSAKLIGVQWECHQPTGATTPCTGTITIDNVSFY